MLVYNYNGQTKVFFEYLTNSFNLYVKFVKDN